MLTRDILRGYILQRHSAETSKGPKTANKKLKRYLEYDVRQRASFSSPVFCTSLSVTRIIECFNSACVEELSFVRAITYPNHSPRKCPLCDMFDITNSDNSWNAFIDLLTTIDPVVFYASYIFLTLLYCYSICAYVMPG